MNKVTEYGFHWGVMNVTRMAWFRPRPNQEHYVLGVDTPHHKLQVSVSKTGRSVRVWRDGVELK